MTGTRGGHSGIAGYSSCSLAAQSRCIVLLHSLAAVSLRSQSHDQGSATEGSCVGVQDTDWDEWFDSMEVGHSRWVEGSIGEAR